MKRKDYPGLSWLDQVTRSLYEGGRRVRVRKDNDSGSRSQRKGDMKLLRG